MIHIGVENALQAYPVFLALWNDQLSAAGGAGNLIRMDNLVTLFM